MPDTELTMPRSASAEEPRGEVETIGSPEKGEGLQGAQEGSVQPDDSAEYLQDGVKSVPKRPIRLRKLGLWGIALSWLGVFAFYGWLGKGFYFKQLHFVVSGGLYRYFASGAFAAPFDNHHALGAMDQPSILKFMVLALFFTVIALPAGSAIRLVGDLSRRRNYLVYALPLLLAVAMGLSNMLPAACLLAQYIRDFGLTPRRLAAATLIVLYVAAWLAAAVLLLRRRKPNRKARA